jgi:hypothetical protein
MNIVEQIHREFDTAQDRLLNEAQTILSKTKAEDIQVGLRLERVGFKSVPLAKSHKAIQKQLVSTQDEANLIQYYAYNYPFLKFLNEPELERICKKYNLIHKPVENYIGEVPEKNLIEIENAQERRSSDAPNNLIYCELKKDNSFFLTSGDGDNWCGIWGAQWYRIPKRRNGIHFKDEFRASEFLIQEMGFTSQYLIAEVTNCTQDRQGLFICAPAYEFEGEDKTIMRVKAIPKDPIVYRYVRGGIQVLSKWGLEASDSDIVNHKMN